MKPRPKRKARPKRPRLKPVTATAPNVASPFYTEAELLAVLKISRTTLFDWRKHKGLPAPLRLAGGGLNRYRVDEVSSWCAEQPREGVVEQPREKP